MNKLLPHLPGEQEQNSAMRRYYRWQSKIYDATRWSFLFGRRALIRQLPFEADAPLRSLEVGCGTGFNLLQLARTFPAACLTGLDVSSDMIKRAKHQTRTYSDRIRLLQQPYQAGSPCPGAPFDLLLFSYSLTMINPQWEELLDQATRDLRPGGCVAVVDFHGSAHPWFKRHMARHHVRMDGHLLPALEARFQVRLAEVRPAYGGTWQYLLFVGYKPS